MHTLAARVVHTCGRACRLRCAGWIDPREVRSVHRSPIFSLRSRPPRRHQAKHYCAVTLGTVSTWLRGSLNCWQSEGGWLCKTIRLRRLPSEEHIEEDVTMRMMLDGRAVSDILGPGNQFADPLSAHRRTRRTLPPCWAGADAEIPLARNSSPFVAVSAHVPVLGSL